MSAIQGQSGADTYIVSYVNAFNQLVQVSDLSWPVAAGLMQNLLLPNGIGASLVFVRCGDSQGAP